MPYIAEVFGLDKGDTLNLRMDPTTSSKVVGTLEAGNRVEVTLLSADRKWGRVVNGEGSAWAYLRYLERKPEKLTPKGLPSGLRCYGTEPFWSLYIRPDDVIEFESPDRQAHNFQTGRVLPSSNMGRMAQTLIGEGYYAVIRVEQCSDGMSDILYGRQIDWVALDPESPRSYSGCCQLSGD